MADDGQVKEATRQAMPLDMMVATFADRQAAKDAYQTLKSMDKEGAIDLDGAVVIDRNEMGQVRLEGATLPGWLWTAIAGVGAVMLGMVGIIVWLGVMTARGVRASMSEHGRGGGYTEAGSSGA